MVCAPNACQEFPVEQVITMARATDLRKGTFVTPSGSRSRENSRILHARTFGAIAKVFQRKVEDLPADELLKFTILEPAMGSAAFLVEQSTSSPICFERKQAEVGQTIPQADYFLERQKVRAYLSDRNCFGVDLNPIAIELGAISLWLNSLHQGEFSPYFGDQLLAGNSFFGARRETYQASSSRPQRPDEIQTD